MYWSRFKKVVNSTYICQTVQYQMRDPYKAIFILEEWSSSVWSASPDITTLWCLKNKNHAIAHAFFFWHDVTLTKILVFMRSAPYLNFTWIIIVLTTLQHKANLPIQSIWDIAPFLPHWMRFLQCEIKFEVKGYFPKCFEHFPAWMHLAGYALNTQANEDKK